MFSTSFTVSFNSCYAFASNAKNHRQRYHSPLFAANSWSNPTPPKWQEQQGKRRHFINLKSGNHWMKILRGGSLPSSPSSTTMATTTTPPVTQFQGTALFASTPTQSIPQKSLSDWAQESLSIAGNTKMEDSLQSFGGLSYRDSFVESEPFRVIFILGGPGMGESVV
jgi:hypothetical protein